MSTLMETKNSMELAGTSIRQLVCFRLCEEEFGIDIYKVHDINRMVSITHIPQSPNFVEGIINLRGQIVPVIDMRKRFGLSVSQDRTKENRIIVVEANGTTTGFIVDAVTQVHRIPLNSIEETPDIVKSSVESKYIEGVAVLENEHLLIVLDTDKIFSESEMKSVAAIAQS